MDKYYSFPSEGFLCWKARDQKTPIFFSVNIEKNTVLRKFEKIQTSNYTGSTVDYGDNFS